MVQILHFGQIDQFLTNLFSQLVAGTGSSSWFRTFKQKYVTSTKIKFSVPRFKSPKSLLHEISGIKNRTCSSYMPRLAKT